MRNFWYNHDVMKSAISLSCLDWTVVAAYFALTMSVGLFMGRFVKGAGDFFSGGKKVPW